MSQHSPTVESPPLLHDFLVSAPTFLYHLRWDGTTFVPDWVSENVPEALGFAAAEITKYGWWESNVHPEDVARILENHGKLFATGRLAQEFRIRAKDGHYLWIRDHLALLRDSAGRPIGAVGAWFDITDRKQAEQALETVGERYELATRAGRVGVWYHDIESGRFEADPFLTELWGGPLDGDATDGRAWLRRVHPADVDRLVRVGREHEEGKTAELRCEYRFTDATGVERWVLSCGRAIRDASGRIRRLAGTTTDITDRKRAELALRETTGRLQQLSRRLMAVQEQERRRLARELHDEIGQLLTGLSFRLDAATKASPTEYSQRLDEARTIVRELTAQVRELSQGLRPSLLDDLGLGPALDWLVSRVSTQTELCIVLTTGHVGRYPSEIETAAYRIVQEALTNVARHAAAKSAEVRITCGTDELVVEIADDGRGFDPSVRQPGTGGLSGMRERAELLGGTLAINSSPTTGTRITARLPGTRNPTPLETEVWL